MMYLDRQGKAVHSLPNLDNYAKVETGTTIERRFVVTLFAGEPGRPFEEEYFNAYPTEAQLLWCLCKHKATSARVQKVYVPYFD